MDIDQIVKNTIEKYDSRNPFEISKAMGIIVLFEPLGDYSGYYNKAYRQKMIHINQDLTEEDQYFTCSHELGHAVMHGESSTPFMRKNTIFSINGFEKEANLFACHLILSKYDKEEFEGLSYEQISGYTGIPEDYLKIIL